MKKKDKEFEKLKKDIINTLNDEETNSLLMITNKSFYTYGDKVEAMSMLTASIKAFLLQGVIDEEELETIVNLATMSNEELEKEAEKSVKKVIDRLFGR